MSAWLEVIVGMKREWMWSVVSGGKKQSRDTASIQHFVLAQLAIIG
jgi:hypothetical protein